MIKEGIVNFYKPEGVTSHDCVNLLRRLTGIRRIGHTGTLDPMATGVLPLCIGSAARITEYLDIDYKTYLCTLTLGLETDTQDVWGKVLVDNRDELKSHVGGVLSEDKIRAAFQGFNGVIEQFPPMYSAVRVDGKRLYEYARAGETVKIKSRKVFIKNLLLEEIDLNSLEVRFRVTCSKGTYIRTICQDVGQALGVGAAMSSLVRVASGEFSLENAVNVDFLRDLLLEKKNLEEGHPSRFLNLSQIEDEVNKLILPIDYPLWGFGTIHIDIERLGWFCNGGMILPEEVLAITPPFYSSNKAPLPIRDEYSRAYKVYAAEKFLGVAFFDENKQAYVPDKIFFKG